MTLKELETNEKLKYWYNHIQNQKVSGMSVISYCRENHLTPSVFYDYLKRLKQLICDEVNTGGNSLTVVPFVPVPKVDNNSTVTITKGPVKVEIEAGTEYSNIESLIKVLLC